MLYDRVRGAVTPPRGLVHASGDETTAAATAAVSGQKNNAAGTVDNEVTPHDADGTKGNKLPGQEPKPGMATTATQQ